MIRVGFQLSHRTLMGFSGCGVGDMKDDKKFSLNKSDQIFNKIRSEADIILRSIKREGNQG